MSAIEARYTLSREHRDNSRRTPFHGQAEAHLLEHHQLAGREAREHGDHDQRRPRDHSGRGPDAVRNRLRVVRRLVKPLPDPAQGAETSEIVLSDDFSPVALQGIDQFSHAEIIYVFDRVGPSGVERGFRRPRGNAAWPEVGIFAQRARNRPNRLGSTIVRIVGCEGRVLRVIALDAIDGTPVLGIKPVMWQFLPREPVKQPAGRTN
jgi:tRNA (Thr-GGU) A37 N-methylase